MSIPGRLHVEGTKVFPLTCESSSIYNIILFSCYDSASLSLLEYCYTVFCFFWVKERGKLHFVCFTKCIVMMGGDRNRDCSVEFFSFFLSLLAILPLLVQFGWIHTHIVLRPYRKARLNLAT